MTARFLLELRKWNHQQASSSRLSRFVVDLGETPRFVQAPLDENGPLETFAAMEPQPECEEHASDTDWGGDDERGFGSISDMTEATLGHDGGTEWDRGEGSSHSSQC